MAAQEKNTLIQTKGKDGNSVLHYPITLTGNVIDLRTDKTLDEILAGIPPGGNHGQVLMKKSGGDYDAEWGDAEGEAPKNPYIGENGNWFEWRDGEYVDSMVKAQGRDAEIKNFIVTLSDNWTYFKPFTQTAAVEGILSEMNPVADILLSDDSVTTIKQLEAWSMIDKIVVNDGSVTLYCYFDKPETEITLQLKAVV